jgi:hypothetical protein
MVERLIDDSASVQSFYVSWVTWKSLVLLVPLSNIYVIICMYHELGTTIFNRDGDSGGARGCSAPSNTPNRFAIYLIKFKHMTQL